MGGGGGAVGGWSGRKTRITYLFKVKRSSVQSMGQELKN